MQVINKEVKINMHIVRLSYKENKITHISVHDDEEGVIVFGGSQIEASRLIDTLTEVLKSEEA